MKILVLDPQFEDIYGGAREVSYTIAEVLSGDHDVKLVHGSSRDKEDFEEFYGLDLSDVEYTRKEKPFSSKLLDSSGRFTLLSRMIADRSFVTYAKKREDEYDVIIFGRHLFDPEIEFNTPVIQYVHAPMKEETFPGKPGIYRRSYRHFAKPRLNSSADVTLYNSEYNKSLNEVPGEVVYPPVDEDFNPNEEKEDQAVIIGRIAPIKGIKEAIELSKSAGLKLKIIGSIFDEEYYEEIKTMAEESEDIQIIVDAERERLRNEIERSKIGFSCNETETFGINVVEYMKGGVVPIATNAAGPKEILKNEDLLFSEIEEAQDKLDNVLSNFDEYQKETLKRSEDFGKSVFKSEILQKVKKFS